jgi:hypothetical protein
MMQFGGACSELLLAIPYSENGPQGDIKSNATAELQKIPKEAFGQCFQQWQDRWGKFARAQWSYLECV